MIKIYDIAKARQGLTVSPLTDPGHIDTIFLVYVPKVSTSIGLVMTLGAMNSFNSLLLSVIGSSSSA